MFVRDVMTRPVVTVEPGTPVKAAVSILTGRGFTLLPVIERDRLVGVVTEADLVRGRVHRDPRWSLLASEPASAAPPGTVEGVMARAVVTATPSGDVADLVEMMLDRHVRSVPVVDGQQLVGIVSRRDVLATFTRSDDALAAAVRCRLNNYGGPGRWEASVHGGVVEITDPFDDEAERHTVRVIASAVTGVLGVAVVPASR
jgi:CBS domain-containing protein